MPQAELPLEFSKACQRKCEAEGDFESNIVLQCAADVCVVEEALKSAVWDDVYAPRLQSLSMKHVSGLIHSDLA